MGLNAQNQDIVNLLTKIKETEPGYPQHLLAARRKRYLIQMGQISLGMSAGTGIRQAIKSTGPTTSGMTTSTLLEAALVVAIIVEAGAVAYFYRDRLADALRTVTSSTEVQEITSPATVTPSPPQDTPTSPVALTSTLEAPTVSAVPSSMNNTPALTLSPSLVESTPPVSAPSTGIASTPTPHDDNGNHYGQTPKPERTKENNGDPPPKDEKDPPPKNDPKPTKSK